MAMVDKVITVLTICVLLKDFLLNQRSHAMQRLEKDEKLFLVSIFLNDDESFKC